MNITFKQMRLFLALSDTLSVTKASQKMGITQPTASMQLKEIAETIGFPLFEVINKKVHLTEMGEKLALTVRAMLNEWQSFEQSIEELKGLHGGSLKVAVVSTAKYFIPKLLGSFYALYPQIDIALEVLNRDGVIKRLHDNKDDLYIMTKPPKEIDIQEEMFMSNPLVIIAHKSHPLSEKNNISLDTLKDERFILRENGSGTRLFTEQHFKKKKFKPKVLLELGNNEAIKKCVESRLGLAVISRHAIEDYNLQKNLSILQVKDFPIASNWFIVNLNGKRFSPIALAFHNHLINEAKKLSLSN
ncbi:LysR family transcriptional regulator [Candidatus Methylopumilus rimovensis]|uniref:LysR family transcriptional regulator n=1 Tax=Candidatus Methylopumilus rimovensis TaxID=2588535 RepID=A0AAE6KPU9_9PROT|nr:LysR family transcriptional regulator [Candidatus Methylopumilus rimovensis]QDD12751.1 LysR family transcriptional regulator [Candidatus Methylopumilus rimovensis]QDD14056.1 LysR family transcriptional regulator [Candidatus Methylopumilus rimovensis]